MRWFDRLLKKRPAEGPKPSLDSIRFDLSDWQVLKRKKEEICWKHRDNGTILNLVFVDQSPDLPRLTNTAALQQYGRELAASDGRNGGIISVDVVDIRGLQIVEVLYKYENLPAYCYTAIGVIPFSQFHYIFAIATCERGTTGVRDAMVTSELLNSGDVQIEIFNEKSEFGVGRLVGWFYDPYDPNYEGQILCSVADDEKYDSRFPQHPLSRVRQLLREIHNSLYFDETIRNEVGNMSDKAETQ